MGTVRVGLGQINVCVGDLEGNLKNILEYIRLPKNLGVDILCFPELAVTGYPPEDLLLKSRFIEDNLETLDKIREHSEGLTVIVGFVDKNFRHL